MIVCIVMVLVALRSAYRVSVPEVGEVAVTWKFLAFFALLWGGTEIVAKRQGRW